MCKELLLGTAVAPFAHVPLSPQEQALRSAQSLEFMKPIWKKPKFWSHPTRKTEADSLKWRVFGWCWFLFMGGMGNQKIARTVFYLPFFILA